MGRLDGKVAGATNYNDKSMVVEELPSRHAKATQIGTVDTISRFMGKYNKDAKDPLADLKAAMPGLKRES